MRFKITSNREIFPLFCPEQVRGARAGDSLHQTRRNGPQPDPGRVRQAVPLLQPGDVLKRVLILIRIVHLHFVLQVMEEHEFVRNYFDSEECAKDTLQFEEQNRLALGMDRPKKERLKLV